MKKLILTLLGTWLLLGGCFLPAQEMPEGEQLPPKVLVIYREYLKPGKAGMAHEKTESAFVQAFSKAKSKENYFAVDSLSGRPRSLFLLGYGSFEDWEKQYAEMQKNTALQAALDHASAADGELQSDADATVVTFREDQSLNAKVDISKYRFFEISLFHVKPGHRKDWDDIVTLVKGAYEKVPDVRWACFEQMYGQYPGGTYVVFTPLKSASDIDKESMQNKAFVEAMGEEGMKTFSELEARAIESSQTNLFAFNPKISYPPDAWVKSDPEFWKPKASAPAKKAEQPSTPQ